MNLTEILEPSTNINHIAQEIAGRLNRLAQQRGFGHTLDQTEVLHVVAGFQRIAQKVNTLLGGIEKLQAVAGTVIGKEELAAELERKA